MNHILSIMPLYVGSYFGNGVVGGGDEKKLRKIPPPKSNRTLHVQLSSLYRVVDLHGNQCQLPMDDNGEKSRESQISHFLFLLPFFSSLFLSPSATIRFHPSDSRAPRTARRMEVASSISPGATRKGGRE